MISNKTIIKLTKSLEVCANFFQDNRKMILCLRKCINSGSFCMLNLYTLILCWLTWSKPICSLNMYRFQVALCPEQRTSCSSTAKHELLNSEQIFFHSNSIFVDIFLITLQINGSNLISYLCRFIELLLIHVYQRFMKGLDFRGISKL